MLKRLKESIRYRIYKAIKFALPQVAILENKNIFYQAIENSISNTVLGKNTMVYRLVRCADSVIGDYSYVAVNSRISFTTIGKFCSIGPNFICGWGVHPTNGVSTSPMFYSTQLQNGVTLSKENKIEERIKIVIGNDVFIGMNVVVLDGVTIGDGAVIGAGAVVANDVPPYAVAVGVPAKVVKHRFDDETIQKLLKIKWWDFEWEQLKLVEKYFFDVKTFISECEKLKSSAS